jgi:hypothetical protein
MHGPQLPAPDTHSYQWLENFSHRRTEPIGRGPERTTAMLRRFRRGVDKFVLLQRSFTCGENGAAERVTLWNVLTERSMRTTTAEEQRPGRTNGDVHALL